MTTRADVARWLALAEAATPGPWKVADLDREQVRTPEGGLLYFDTRCDAPCFYEVDDAVFVTASRTAVPAMGEMLERWATALRMVTPGMWHEVDEAVAEWRGEVPEDGCCMACGATTGTAPDTLEARLVALGCEVGPAAAGGWYAWESRPGGPTCTGPSPSAAVDALWAAQVRGEVDPMKSTEER